MSTLSRLKKSSSSQYQRQQVLELRRKNVPIRKTAELVGAGRGSVYRFDKKHRVDKQVVIPALACLDQTSHYMTYPDLGHAFYPSSQWSTGIGPIEQYGWLEAHSGLSHSYVTTATASTIGANTSSLNTTMTSPSSSSSKG